MEPAPGTERASKTYRWNLIAVGLALVTTVGAVTLPVLSRSSTNAVGERSSSTVSLLADNGPMVVILAALPPALIALPLLLPPRGAHIMRVVLCTALGALVVLGAASIGAFVIPTAVALVIATSADRPAKLRPPPAGPPTPIRS